MAHLHTSRTAAAAPLARRLVAIRFAVIAVVVALAALLAYSLDRTAWLFAAYEPATPYGVGLAVAAAIVIELAAVALIAGEGVMGHAVDDRARQWANRALVLILGVQWIANLSAGFLRGAALDTAFGAAPVPIGGSVDARYVVLAAMWLFVNTAVPGVIFCLAKFTAILIARWVAVSAELAAIAAPADRTAPAQRPQVPAPSPQLAAPPAPPAPQLTAGSPQLAAPHDAVTTAILAAYRDDARAETATIAAAAGVSARTVEGRRAELVRSGVLVKDGRRFTLGAA